jgi:beta-N-acetylhexosaminidase
MTRTSSSFLWIAGGFLSACLLVGLGIGVYLGVSSVKAKGEAPRLSKSDALMPALPASATFMPTGTALSQANAQPSASAIPTLASKATTAPKPTLVPTLPLASPKPTQPLNPTPAATKPAPTPTTDPWIEDQLNKMSLVQKAGQVIMTGLSGTSASPENCNLLKSLLPGGVAYTGLNVNSANDLRAFSAGLQSCMNAGHGLPLLVGMDHEGQYIDRFKSGATLFPAALAIGATHNFTIANQMAFLSGQELLYAGVNMVLGPDADVLTQPDNAVISQRSFGGVPEEVAQNVVQALVGYRNAGIIPVLKHFPGHGGTAADSHTVLPVDYSDLESIQQVQWVPFQAGIAAGAEVVMVGHVAFPKLDPRTLPASLSKPVFDRLRNQLGFKGLALSDSMGMGAVTQGGRTVPDASLMAIKAGMDMVIITSPALAVQTRDLLVNSVNNNTLDKERLNEAVRRILTLKAAHHLKNFAVNDNPAPDLAANQKVSEAIGRAAVSIETNSQKKLVPIPSNVHKVLILGPTDAVLQNLSFYETLKKTLEPHEIIATVDKYSINSSSNPDYAASASGYDLVIFLSFEAHLNADAWQIQSVKALVRRGTPLVVVALKGPFDLLDFPNAPVYLATMGTTPGQAQGLADLLVGNVQTGGRIPASVR